MNKKMSFIIFIGIFFLMFLVYLYTYARVNNIKNDIVIPYMTTAYKNIDSSDLELNIKRVDIFSDTYKFGVEYNYYDTVIYVTKDNGSYNVKVNDDIFTKKEKYDDYYYYNDDYYNGYDYYYNNDNYNYNYNYSY